MRIKHILLVVVLSICSLVARTAEENLFHGLQGAEIVNNSKVLIVKDEWYSFYLQNSASNYFHVESSKAKVKLWFDDALMRHYTSAWQFDITYDLELTNSNGFITTILGESLSIDFDPVLNYRDINLEVYDNDIFIQAKLSNVQISSSSNVPGTLTDDFHLDLELNTERYYKLDASEVASVSYNTNSLAGTNELEIVWSYIEGAESYDLEWLFIDIPETNNPPNILSSYTGNYDFKNATRINSLTNNYKISLAYPRGIFLLRVRPVGKKLVAGALKRTEGTWSLATQGLVNSVSLQEKYNWSGLLPGMNWNYEAGFSEEGKKIEMMNIYDESLKPRQQIAINNSDNTALISQPIYDFLGRPTLGLLPSPEENKGLKFYEDRTKILGNNYYDYEEFDVDGTGNFTIVAPQSMAGLDVNDYYSSSGTSNAYVADAEGFPFTRTILKNDGTGRVKQQTMAGASVIGSSNQNAGNAKTMKYYYGTPTQEELYKLFGNEVGNASHYKKNMVIDQNGQISIQYIDMAGRVIATALAGDTPTNLLQIDSYPTNFESITANLLENNYLNNQNSYIVNKTITVSEMGSIHTFDYSLADAEIVSECFPSGHYFHYDLLIYIEDENGDRLSIDYDGNQSNETEYILTDITSETNAYLWTVNLDIGTYTITKVLSLNQNYIATLAGIFTLNPSQTCYGSYIPTVGLPCNETSEEMCISQFLVVEGNGERWFYNESGELIAVISADDTDTTYYHVDEVIELLRILEIIKDCQIGAQPASENKCEDNLASMKVDMSPGGQYFDNTPFLSNTAASNTWLVANRTADYTLVDGSATSWDDIRLNWVDSYADNTVKLHPEYCTYLLNCADYTGTYNGSTVSVPSCPTGWTGSTVAEYENILINAGTNIALPSNGDFLYNPLKMTTSTVTATAANRQEYQPANDGMVDAHVDPFMACRPFLKAELEDLLIEYYDVFGNGTEFHSIWYVLDDPDDIHLGNPSSNGINYPQATIDYYQQIHGDGTTGNIGLIGTNSGQTPKFQFFKSSYQFLKNYITYNSVYNTSITSPIVCTPAYKESPAGNGLDIDGFTIVYPKNDVYEDFTSSGSALTATVQNSIASQCQAQCSASAQEWLSTLDNCALPADLLIMETYFIDICIGSCDEDNTAGLDIIATAVSGDWGPMSSFTDVVTHYNTVIAPGGTDCSTPTHPQNSAQNDLNDGTCECDAITAAITAFYVDNNVAIPSTFNLTSDLNPAQLISLVLDFDDYLVDLETIDVLSLQNWLNDCAAGNYPTSLISSFICNDPPAPDLNQFDIDCGLANDILQSYFDELAFNASVQEGWLTFISDYYSSAWNNLDTREVFTMEYTPSEFHYTLFYYDQAGNLIKTVPPAGIHKNLDGSEGLPSADIQLCKDHLTNSTQPFVHPNHSQITNYKYNSLQQLVEQNTPDGGETIFFYDELGRLIVSQNAEQALFPEEYSYTVYDLLGRITEAGEISSVPPFTAALATNPIDYYDWRTAGVPIKKEVIKTIYDYYADNASTIVELGNIDPNSVRNRIGSVILQDVYNASNNIFSSAIHYAYDELGNVKTIVDENRDAPVGAQYKKMEYIYDIISGNVQKVNYQPGAIDQFYHKYEYDANNRLTNTYTSTNNEIWEKEAKSIYYAHGPLARLEIGDKTVQAEDFVYTLNGWLKTVNSSVNNSDWDAGRDGKQITEHKYVGRDAFGFSLEYYQGDYKAVDVATADNLTVDFYADYDQQSPGLFNGNISKMITSISDLNENGLPVFESAYRYDQLNRIKSSIVFKTNGPLTPSTSITSIRDANAIYTVNATNNGEYQTAYSFDGNGNLQTLERNYNNGQALMDDFTYSYNNADGKINQLLQVSDAVNNSIANTGDLKHGMAADNYEYNEIGQLTQDKSEDIEIIEWTVTGKVKKIIFNDILNTPKTTTINYIEYKYNPMDMRLSKAVVPLTGPTITTFYVYDASGNVMATYQHTENRPGEGTVPETFYLNDHHIYASKRLGVANRNIEMLISPASENLTRVLGNKKYELANHLGNVLQVISDRRLSVDDNTDLMADYYTPDVTSFSDYYPYGMQMPGRYGIALGGEYRYGFQGYESDDEVKGEGNSYTTEFRQYDPRVARWLSIDPVVKTHESPYSSFANNPIWFSDPNGADTTIEISTSVQNVDGVDFTVFDYIKTEQTPGALQIKFFETDASGNRVLVDTKTGILSATNPNGIDPNSYFGRQLTSDVTVYDKLDKTGPNNGQLTGAKYKYMNMTNYKRYAVSTDYRSFRVNTMGVKVDLDLDFGMSDTKFNASEVANYWRSKTELDRILNVFQVNSTIPLRNPTSGNIFRIQTANRIPTIMGFHSPEDSKYKPPRGTLAHSLGLTGNAALDINRAESMSNYVISNSSKINRTNIVPGGVSPRRKVTITF